MSKNGSKGKKVSAGARDAAPQEAEATAAPWKRYLDAVAATGARTEKLALAAVTLLLLLFFGFILPSAWNIHRIMRLRADSDRTARLMLRLDMRKPQNAWHERQYLGASSEDESSRTPDCPREAFGYKSLSGIESTLRKLESSAAKQQRSVLLASKRDPLEILRSHCELRARCASFGGQPLLKLCTDLEQYDTKRYDGGRALLGEATKKFEQAVAEQKPGLPLDMQVEHETDWLKEACDYPGLVLGSSDLVRGTQELCWQLSFLKYRARKAQLDRELSSVTQSQLSLKFLKLLGLNAEGIDDLKVPLLFLPVCWSLILLILLAYAGASRNAMLNLYARATRSCLEAKLPKDPPPTASKLDENLSDELVDELGGVPRSPWWWLAPLPSSPGNNLGSATLRRALGWKSFHLVPLLGVSFCLGALLLMQAAVLLIGAKLTYAFTDGVDADAVTEAAEKTLFDALWGSLLPVQDGPWGARAIVPLLVVLTLVSVMLVVRWLWPLAKVPDLPTNEQDAWQPRRLALTLLGATLAGLLLSRRDRLMVPTAALVNQRPRFRQRKRIRAVDAGTLSQGFYRDSGTQLVHYVLPAHYASMGHRLLRGELRSKRRRKPMTRFERKAFHHSIRMWRDSGEGLEKRPRRVRTTRGAPKPPPMPRKIVKGSTSGPGPGPGPEGTVCSPRGATSLPNKQGGQVPATSCIRWAHTVDPGKLEPLAAHAAIPAVAASWSERSDKVPGPMRPSALAFAIEQEVLHRLSGGPEGSRAGEACSLLRPAIQELLRRQERSVLRLCDLYAVIAHKRNLDEDFKWLIATVERAVHGGDDPSAPSASGVVARPDAAVVPADGKKELPSSHVSKAVAATDFPSPERLASSMPKFHELAQRLRSWKDCDSNWYRRWSKRTNWAGLLM